MPPKTVFTKEYILKAAIELVKSQGFDSLTARKLAARMQSSVAPIYDNFDGIGGLKTSVIDELYIIHMGMVNTDYTQNYFLNLGIGTLRFAEEYRKVFNDYLTIKKKLFSFSDDEHSIKTILYQMRKDEILINFSDQELLDLLIKMEIFTHGIASIASMNLFPNTFDEYDLMSFLSETSGALIMNKLYERNNKK